MTRFLPPLDNDWYDGQAPEDLAIALLGQLLCRRSREGVTVGRILETEAYLATDDSAAHSAHGINRKNAAMFGPPGRAYVYTIHARQCVNVVTEAAGRGSAVLIRALEPLQGIARMEQRRNTTVLRDLCRGPARLCEALAIGRALNGWNLSRGQRLWIAGDPEFRGCEILVSPRIGVTSAAEKPLRFFASANPFVSGTGKFNRQATRLSAPPLWSDHLSDGDCSQC